MRNDFSYALIARCVLFLFSFISQPAAAAILQIIHTNDLHSHFEQSSKADSGNYAAVKAVIDKIKYEAYDKGLETLVVDAGDFSEGSQFYLADRGEQSWRAMNTLGYDAVLMGNHDYLLGPIGLERIITNVKPDFFLLGANFHSEKKYANTYQTILPRVRLERNADWISVMGLTTDDFVYTWRAGKGVINSPIETANALVPKYRKDSAFVIALTHLGLSQDQKLVRSTKGIDLVIGGHSHDALFNPIYERSADGKYIPIVQAGEHGNYVGDLLVDLVPGKPAKILHYRLVPVNRNGPKDPETENFIAYARKRLDASYPANWLTQQIGYSEVPMVVPKAGKNTTWGDILGKGMLRVTKADIAFNATNLYGDSQPAGPITREKLIQYYPRVFEFYNFTTGWNVWTCEVEGWILKYFVQDAIRQGYQLTLTGATFTVSGAKGSESISNFKIGTSSVKSLRTYKVALPEGIGRVLASDYYNSRLLAPVASSKVSMWAAMEIELMKQGGMVRE